MQERITAGAALYFHFKSLILKAVVGGETTDDLLEANEKQLILGRFGQAWA